MGDHDHNVISGQMQRLRDVYRVHDSKGKQKKQQRNSEEKDFMEELEESEKNLEGYEHEQHEKPRANKHSAGALLNALHSVSAPIFVEELKSDVEDEKKK